MTPKAQVKIPRPADHEEWFRRAVDAGADVEERDGAQPLANGHLDAITHLGDLLARESDTERLLEHVARMIHQRTEAETITFWARNERDEIDRMAVYSGDALGFPSESSSVEEFAAWRRADNPAWVEFFGTGSVCVESDYSSHPPLARVAGRDDSRWLPVLHNPGAEPILQEVFKHLRKGGTVTTLCTPMISGGDIQGMLCLRFAEKRDFRPDQLELIQSLARQAMLMIEIKRLSRQNRSAAILSERNRMARDIHDTIAQGLTGVIVQLDAAEDARQRNLFAESENHLARARELAKQNLQEARRSVMALRPASLEQHSLCQAISQMMRQATEGTSLKTELVTSGTTWPIPSGWDEHLLCIGQEALTNTLRHSEAGIFSARLEYFPDRFNLVFADDGRGLPSGDVPEGFGLIGMRERVAAMGGELVIASQPGQGVAIVITLPAPSPDHEFPA